MPPMGAVGVPMGPVGGSGSMLYLLWSIERVGVIYDVVTIGNFEWYSWGSNILLRMQRTDGSWNAGSGETGPDVDTCFALLFLNRPDVAKDLTNLLNGKGESALKSGGATVSQNPSSNPGTGTNSTQSGSELDIQATRLMEGLIKASGSKRTEIINTLRDSKGESIPKRLRCRPANFRCRSIAGARALAD